MPNYKEYAEQHLILFDGICNLCNRSVSFIIRNDPDAKFKFAALQHAKGRDFLQHHQFVNNPSESVVYIRNGREYAKSSAFLEIVKELGWPWKIFYIFKVIPLQVRDYLYDHIAKRRYRIFGKRNTCMIPTRDVQDRFII